MEPGHLRCRRRARRRPQGARAAGTSKQGTSDGRGEAAHSTAHRIREGGTGKHRATEGPRPPQRLSTSRKRRTSRPAVTEHVGDESPFALYRSPAPDSTAGAGANCLWTGRAQPMSSAVHGVQATRGVRSGGGAKRPESARRDPACKSGPGGAHRPRRTDAPRHRDARNRRNRLIINAMMSLTRVRKAECASTRRRLVAVTPVNIPTTFPPSRGGCEDLTSARTFSYESPSERGFLALDAG